MKYSHLFSGLLSLLVVPSLYAQLSEAEELLRGKQSAEAAVKLAAVPAEQKADGYADWLRAVALYQFRKQTEAIAATEAVPENSRWFRKARLLKARALSNLKKHAEAATIYAAEATRALASARKDELAGLLVAFGDEVGREPAAGEIEAPPADVARTARLYQQALEVDYLTPKFQDETMFKLAVAYQKLNQHQNALRLLNDYLIQFDKSWQAIELTEVAGCRSVVFRQWKRIYIKARCDSTTIHVPTDGGFSQRARTNADVERPNLSRVDASQKFNGSRR